MSHHATGMARMEHPAKRLGEITTRIQNPRNMSKDNVSKSLPILDGKPLNGYVPRALSRLLGIDQFNG